MRVLVTGSTGFLGGEAAAELVARGLDVVGAARRAERERDLQVDLAEPGAVERLLRRARPDAVLHLAALADIAPCRENPALARRLNTEAPADLARGCAALGLRLLAVSTDQVFDGTRGLWREDDRPAPRHLYGETKLAGEHAILNAHPAAAIVRPALVTGRAPPGRRSASSALLEALARGEHPRMFTDEIRSPIAAEDLARALVELLLRPAVPESAGIFHGGGPEPLSRYDLARREAAAAGFDPALIAPATRAQAGLADERPADLSLNSARLFTLLGWAPRTMAGE